MTEPIGELLLQNGQPLLKMWVTSVLPGDRPFVRHAHTRFEIMTVNRGAGQYTTEDAVYPMEPGDVFVFSSNEVHCITRAGAEGLSITNLHFEPRYLAGGAEDPAESFIQFCFSHAPAFRNRIPAGSAGDLRGHLLCIREELLQGRSSYPTAVKAHLYLILIGLLREHGYQAPAGSSGQSSGILAVYDYIDRHLCEPLRLEDIAAAAGLSPNYFSHVFRQLNGISLWDYISAKRIEKAASLLGDGSRTVLEIALQCGFNNTVNFNKAFRKHKGMTPTQYRKSRDTLMH